MYDELSKISENIIIILLGIIGILGSILKVILKDKLNKPEKHIAYKSITPPSVTYEQLIEFEKRIETKIDSLETKFDKLHEMVLTRLYDLSKK